MKQIFLAILFIGFASAESTAFAQASSGGSGSGMRWLSDWQKKSDTKKASRWTLEDWLAQRDRNRLMDMWLAMNTSEPYEFSLAGEYSSYQFLQEKPDPKIEQSYTSYRGAFTAYASIVGLEYQYENNTAEQFYDHIGIFHLRLLGKAYQGTNITLDGGLRSRHLNSSAITMRNQFVGASATFYLIHSFGIEGLYRSYLPYEDDTLGKVSGRRIEGGAFIEFDFLRIYGTWFDETQDTELGGSTTNADRTGINTGIKIFF